MCNHMVCAMIRDFLCYGYSASGIFYFSVGVAIHCLKIKEPCRCCAIICGIAGFSLLAVRLALVCRESFLLADVGILTIPFVLYFIWYFIPAVSLPDWLTSCSFPIFLIHTIVFQWFATGLKQLPIGELSQAMLTFVFGVFASLTITMLLRRSYPKCSVALFGGR